LKIAIPSLYATYGRYTDALRAIPGDVDALKPVERRLLLCLHEVARGGKFVKSAKIVGQAIAHYHPHGDLSTYASLISLAKRGFAEPMGNWGHDALHSVKAAAYRYTEIKTSSYLDKMFSEFLDFVPWEKIELEKEPLYLPSPIPLGLIGNGFITGISFNITKIPRYSFFDLISRTHALLTNQTPPTIIPQVENCDVYEETVGDFEKILTTGIGTVQIVPKIIVKNNSVYILGKNPLIGFSRLISFNEKYEEKNKIPYYDVIDLTEKKVLCIEVTPRKGNCDQQFIHTVQMQVSSKVNVKCNFVSENGTVQLYSIDQILFNAFSKWKDAWMGNLKDELAKSQKKIRELNIISIIRMLVESGSSLKKVDDLVTGFRQIYAHTIPYNKMNIEDDEIRQVCGKYRIKTLIEKDIDIVAVQGDLKRILGDIKDHDKLTLDRLDSLK
jgi:DNA gyrase/topoisomerase IV subunit A